MIAMTLSEAREETIIIDIPCLDFRVRGCLRWLEPHMRGEVGVLGGTLCSDWWCAGRREESYTVCVCWVLLSCISNYLSLVSTVGAGRTTYSSMGGHSLRLTGWQENLGAGYSSPAQYWPDSALQTCAVRTSERACSVSAVSKLRQSVAYTGDNTRPSLPP